MENGSQRHTAVEGEQLIDEGPATPRSVLPIDGQRADEEPWKHPLGEWHLTVREESPGLPLSTLTTSLRHYAGWTLWVVH